MALFIFLAFLINVFTVLYGFNYPDSVKVMITPPLGTYNHHPPAYFLFQLNETLNLTCSITSEMPDIHLEWILPGKTTNSQNKVDTVQGDSWVNLVIRNLQENDSGEYKCTASSNTNPDLMLDKVIRIKVKALKPETPKPKPNCGDNFKCGNEYCINKRFTCDGKIDCSLGEDESEVLCGPDPCKDKRLCSNGRCIPANWCCDPAMVNCTIRTRSSCCAPLRDLPDSTGYHDVTLFQTTVYTVIGCAMAFMFIVTIFIVAVCRVHMRRSLMRPMNAPFVSQSNRPSDRFNALPFYDFDVLVNRSNDGVSLNPLLVTYNINNGVQFVGRPVDPPPYCEVVATPPREGPPPPYMSRENLTEERNDSEDASEGDTLLTPHISVISDSRIDLRESSTASCAQSEVEPVSELPTNL